MKRTLAVPLLAAGVTLVAVPSPARAEPARLPVAGADLVSVRLESGDLALRVRDAGDVRAGRAGGEPSEVDLDAGPGYAGVVPGRREFAFLGPAGTPVWVLAADGDFPSFDATAVPRGRLAGDAVTVRLLDVEGPGRFHAYAQSGLARIDVLLSSAPGGPAHTTIAAGQRRGGVLWAFDTPGTYRIRLGVAGLDPGGREIGDEATYRIDVPETVPVAATRAERAAGPAPARETAAGGNPAPQRAAAPAPKAAPATGRTVIADGHVDMGPQLDGNTWRIRLRDDTASPPVWRELSDVVLHAVDKTKAKVPPGAAYSFLGPAGSEVWMLPQAQQAGIVWPGWNTQDPSVVNGVTGDVTWRLTSVTGPGRFALFLTGSFGQPEVLFDSGRSLPQHLRVPLNTHAHGSWAFTRPGVYRLGIEMTATTRAGGAVSDRRTLTIAVGGVDPDDAFAAPGSRGGGGSLPRTGSSWVVTAGVTGAASVVAGALLVVATRRRRAGGTVVRD